MAEGTRYLRECKIGDRVRFAPEGPTHEITHFTTGSRGGRYNGRAELIERRPHPGRVQTVPCDTLVILEDDSGLFSVGIVNAPKGSIRLARFPSAMAAEEFISLLEGHADGRYYLDAPAPEET